MPPCATLKITIVLLLFVGHNVLCSQLDNSTVQNSTTPHKGLFHPFDTRDIITTALLFTGGAISAGGGIGGGGVFVPILILIGGFQTRFAVPLSNALIGGASIANYIQMGPRRHPFAKRPLIEYNLALLMQPMALAGTIIGAVLHVLFPDWVILALLIATLGLMVIRTAKKGISLWRTESHRIVEYTSVNYSGAEEEDGISLLEFDSQDQSSEYLAKEKKTPWLKILVLFVNLCAVFVHALLIGGKTGISIINVQRCSMIYWAFFLGIIPVQFLFTFFIARHLISENVKKEEADYPFLPSDIRWQKKKTIIFCVVSFSAGILASLLGLGGGMLLSPVMLEFNLLADVTAATASFMILFTSISSTAQYFVSGTLIEDYGLFFAGVGLLSSFVGQTLLNWLLKKYNRRSYIVIAIFLVIAASTVLLLVTGMIRVVKMIQQHQPMGFHSYC